MKTKRYTPGWTLGIIVASLLGMAVWYFVGRWLEPKPLWQKNHDGQLRQFHPVHYDPVQRLFVGIEYLHDESDITFAVVEAKTGNTIARLQVGQLRSKGITKEFAACSPHVMGNRVYRFALRVEGNQEIMELRSWAFLTDQQERVEHAWHIDLSNWYPMWSNDQLDHFFIHQTLPNFSSIISAGDNSPGLGQVISLIGLNYPYLQQKLVESWRIDSSKATCLCRWIEPITFDRKSSPELPGKLFSTPITNFPTKLRSQVIQTDTTCGKTTSLSFIEGTNPLGIQYLDSRLIMLKSHEPFTSVGPTGVSQLALCGEPTSDRPSPWTMDDWRPVYNLQTNKRIKWPIDLGELNVMNDTMAVDSKDHARLFYSGKTLRLDNLFKLFEIREDDLKLRAHGKLIRA